MNKTHFRILFLMTFLFIGVGIVNALTMNSSVASWTNVVENPPTCFTTQTVSGDVQIRFGDTDAIAGCPGDPSLQSGFGFRSVTSATFNSGVPFVLGDLTHYNNPIIAEDPLRSADLNLDISFGTPAYAGTFATTVTLDETANLLNPCPYGGTQPCSDLITMSRESTLFMVSGTQYQFEFLGVIPGTSASCVYNAAQLSDRFISAENAANSVCLFGRLTAVQPVSVAITKTTSVTTAAPGSEFDYQIDYNCASITTSCADVVITDYLPTSLEYVTSLGSTHTASSEGTYSSSNHSVRFVFKPVLSAGSTGFVIVRVRVRNDGTLANGLPISNTGVSVLSNGQTTTTINNGVTVAAVSNWNVVKSAPANVYLDSDPPVTNNTYTVGICSEGSSVNLLDAQMVDTLPEDAVFVSATGTYILGTGTPQTITWELGNLAASGGCANRQVTVQYPTASFAEDEIVTNTVSAAGNPVGEPAWSDTASVSNPLDLLIANPSVTLTKVSDRTSYIEGAIALFRMRPQNTGNVPLHNFTITDTLPATLHPTRITTGQYQNYSGGQVTIRYRRSDEAGETWIPWGTYASNTTLNVSTLALPAGVYITHLQWQYGIVQPGFVPTSIGNEPRVYALVTGVEDGALVTNDAVLSWDYPAWNGGEGISGTELGSATLTVTTAPTPLFTKTSQGGVSSSYRFLVGQEVGYYTLNPNNNSGATLDEFMITDTLPYNIFRVTSVRVGQYNNYTGQVQLRYQTSDNPGVWVDWGAPLTPNNQTLSAPAGITIAALQWDFGTVVADFAATSTANIYGEVIDGTADGASIVNRAQVTWSFEDLEDSLPEVSVTDTVRIPTTQASPSKATTTPGPYIPSSIVGYSLRVMAASNAPSALIDPIVMDWLPANIIYDSWTYNAGSSGVSAPVFETVPDFNGSGRTLLIWRFSGTFAQGQSATINLRVAVGPGAPTGPINNEYFITTDTMPIINGVPDVDDLDQDGSNDDMLNRSNTSTITVTQLVGLDSVKGVRGELDTSFSFYPNTGHTIPNGEVTYSLSIINEGNIPITNVKVIDILPFVGDTGVQDLSPRGSEWTPILTGLVAAPAGITVYYSTSGNPCRPEIVASGPAGCSAANWSTSPPANITLVRSLRFDFAGVLAPGQTFNFTWGMQAPSMAMAPEGSIAWNSFAFTSTNADTGYPLRPAEPNKVGIEIELPEYQPLIQVVKSTNGEDANFAPGPYIATGAPVAWTYVLQNLGNTRLGSVTLTDDRITGLTCAEGVIPVLEPFNDDPAVTNDTFTCTVIGTAVVGQYANLATVNGSPIDEGGDPLEDPETGNILPDVSDTDPSHYFGYNPALARLGDFVWVDTNGDGVQDSGEFGLPGIQVELLPGVGSTVLATTTTNGDGLYTFVDLADGSYRVRFGVPGFYIFTTQDSASATDATDNDASTANGETAAVTLTGNAFNQTLDAGVVARASLGDLVWLDSDNDGIRDLSELPRSGVTVTLFNAGDNSVAGTTVTDDDGIYRFIDLVPGDYYLIFSRPAGFVFAQQNVGADNAVDSDPDRLTGQTETFTLLPGTNDPTWDAGLVRVASVGNRVWSDLNNNGLLDGEAGINGVSVTLYSTSAPSTPVATTTTATLGGVVGSYLFPDLVPGEYFIRFGTLPSYQRSIQQTGTADNNSDADIITGDTPPFTLAPNQNDITRDAGLVPLVNIGDRVWYDTDGDGVQDGGETGASSVLVTLFRVSDDAQIVQMSTDGSGNYQFTDLPPDSYYVQFTLPAGYVFSPLDVGDNNNDSDVPRTYHQITGRTANVTLTPGTTDLSWDAGLVLDAEVGDYGWYDSNHDGIQDGGELPAENVTVRLYTSANLTTPLETTQTDSSGLYLFDRLIPGSYVIEFGGLPTGYVPTRRDVGGDASDSDAPRFPNPATYYRIPAFTLGVNGSDLTRDIGLVQAASLGDFVWVDTDGDGIQDSGETGLSNVTVRLLSSTGSALSPAQSTTTDTNGEYHFDNIPPDDYVIEVVLPSGYLFSLQNQGGDDETDSDVNITNGRSSVINLSPNETDLTWDAGLISISSIGDFVWRDNDNDGVQDSGEPGIQGVTINLYLTSDPGTVLATTTTSSTGAYNFPNLRNDSYFLTFSMPPSSQGNFLRSPQDQGGDDDLDSDADIAGTTTTIVLPTNTAHSSWDAGYVPLATIGNFVWRDNDNDGVQDAGEPGVENVSVELRYTADDTLARPATTTDSSGFYSFNDLEQDDYYLVFEEPAGYQRSPQDQGGNNATDSDADADGRTISTNLIWGEIDNDWDAGLVPLVTIGDRVWYDTDADGVQDGGETGASGVQVTMFRGDDTQIGQMNTNASGNYLFTDLPPAQYYVQFALPTGYLFSPQDQGGNNNTDSDVTRVYHQTTGRTVTTTFAPGANDISWDAGLVLDAEIGDFVWYDTDDDGIQDSGELGVENVTVRLLTTANVTIDTTTTNASGNYLFDRLVPGSYRIEFLNLPTGYLPARQDVGTDASDSDVPRTAPYRTITTTLTSNENDMTWDMGLVRVASIGDRVWVDADGDGVQDGGETGINGVTVRLLNSSGTLITTTTTNASGIYNFPNLPSDSYFIEVVLPTGYLFSLLDQGGDDALDSDIIVATSRSAAIVLPAGTDDTRWDAGLVPVSSIGDRVWIDSNNNGILDGAEVGYNGATVTLYRTSAPTTVVATTTTATLGGVVGSYNFPNLRNDSYFVRFTLPAGYVFSLQDQEADDTVDSDADIATGDTTTIVLPPNTADTRWDAGIMQTAAVGDFVWRDNNNNGIQDGGEPGVQNVTVSLYDTNDVLIGTQTTPTNGSYSFTGLRPQSYYLTFSLPSGYIFSPQGQGTTATDSNPNSTGRGANFTLAPNATDNTHDAGLVPLARISNFVWRDDNDNGRQDMGEPGIVGVTVRLYDSSNVEIATTTTVTGGLYSFIDLVPGTYSLGFELPDSSYVFARQDAAVATDANDSDADRSTGRTISTLLDPGENDTSWDAGMMQRSSLGNRLWNDINDNGLQDGGELGYEGVTVTLYGEGGFSDTTTTDPSGEYVFSDLVPGAYHITFALPADYVFSRQNIGADDEIDSDVDRTTGDTGNITLPPDTDDLTWDAGIMQVASVGDFVWHDLNDDGIQDGGEPGVAGVRIDLYSTGNTTTPVQTYTTTSTGLYAFNNVVPGDYYIVFTLPADAADYAFSRTGQGTAATDSNPNRTTGQTVTFTVLPSDNDLTQDAGILERVSIGNFVWNDVNDNGVQDSGETGYPNVTVNLYRSSAPATIVATTTTDGDGFYTFGQLVPDNYFVEFVLPTGYTFSRQDVGGNTPSSDETDSDASRTTGRTISTHLVSSENDDTWDAGIMQFARVGDFVWEDLDNDGVQDSGEPGMAGVRVDLYSTGNTTTPVQTYTTTSTGVYDFQNLVPDEYYVVFTLPSPDADYAFTRTGAGTAATDSDANITTGQTPNFTLMPGQHNQDVDAGILERVAIGNFVWNDTNDNGVQDAAEDGIAGVTVRLYSTSDTTTPVDTFITTGTGLYSFTRLLPDTYYLEFELPAGYGFSRSDVGADNMVDSDVQRVSEYPATGVDNHTPQSIGRTINVTLNSGDNDQTWDAGVVERASIGDFVWFDGTNDVDGDNGLQASDPAVEGIVVHLYDDTDTRVGTRTTAADGSYSFDSLLPGSYHLEFVLPDTDTVFTIPNANGNTDDGVDSDVIRVVGQASGFTPATTLAPGENDTTWDAGLTHTASIGDRVWEDLNDNGLQDNGEPNVSGISVTLYDENDVVVGTDTTDTDGIYGFTDLFPGEYYLEFTLPSSGYVFSRLNQDASTPSGIDSDVIRVGGQTSGFTAPTRLIADENDLTWDAGMMQVVSIGNFVWHDENDNGLQDTGEAGIEGVTVHFYDVTDILIATTTTDVNGEYTFTTLIPGEYYVVFELPAGYDVFSRQNAGADDTIDSDADRTTGATVVTRLLPGENDTTWDAGLMQYASIGDLVWNDSNDDGIQDSGELGIENVVVELYDASDTLVDDTPTAADGSYSFTDLVPGDYYVIFTLPSDTVFSRPNVGADDAVDSDADTTTGRTDTTHLTSGENDATWDAGIMGLASVGDFVWYDADDNGLQDTGETGFADVVVSLYDAENSASPVLVDTYTTLANGLYTFTDLVPGNYYLTFTLPAGTDFSRSNIGADDALDSDADRSTGQTVTFHLLAGANDDTWDTGVLPFASIGDFVWDDLNANGVQDAGEPGLEGVTVTLYDNSGTVVTSTTTDSSGNYSFTGLVPETYTVEFTAPTGYLFSPIDAGGDDALDSDADSASSGRTIPIRVLPAENTIDWDAGFYRLATIGDFVWDDLNADGLQDAGESGIEGVTVTLYNALDVEQASTTTGANGLYSFTGLVPGDYYVVFTLPAGYVPSPQDAGDDALDSDADLATGSTSVTNLISGENDTSWDSGMYRTTALGNRVWEDMNANGVQDAGEPGIEGVEVELYDTVNALVSSTTTDVDGAYLFTNLLPGDYYVTFLLPGGGYQFTASNIGADNGLDSDADVVSGSTDITNLISNEVDLTWDAGLLRLASLGDFVWLDVNANGVQDMDEAGVPDIFVTLYNSSNTALASTLTDANGAYSFDLLLPGTYYVGFTAPEGFGFSDLGNGSADTDSNANLLTGFTSAITLVSNQDDPSWDAGIFPLGSLGDVVWIDGNGNGVQDAGEAGIPGVTVQITLPDGTTRTTITDASGSYTFSGLRPGSYTVQVILDTLPDGMEPTYELDTLLDGTVTITLDVGEDNLTIDFGYVIPIVAGSSITPTASPSPTVTPSGTGGTPTIPTGICQRGCTDWMLYHTDETGDWEIFRLDGSQERRDIDLTDAEPRDVSTINLSQGDDSEDIAPSRSPNAEWIIFASNRDGNWELYLAPTTTTGDEEGIRRLTYNNIAKDTNPVWGPNNFTVFETTRNGNWDLYLMDMETGATRPLTSNTANDVDASWSPDGSKIIFQSDRSGQWQIYELTLETMMLRLLSDGQGNDFDPQYNNAGDRIAFRSYRHEQQSVIYTMNADGTNIRRVSDPLGESANHLWSPSDTLIAYQSDLDGDLDIYVFDVTTGQTRKVTDNNIPDYAPMWRCDSDTLVFTSNVKDNPNIFSTDALPITAPAIVVDDEEETDQLTFELSQDIYPLDAPAEEVASREGRLPGMEGEFAEHTSFLVPDVTTTERDMSIQFSEVWEAVNGCLPVRTVR